VSKSSETGTSIGCVFVLAMASGIVLYAVLPLAGVEVPLWVKIAAGVVCGALLLVALAVTGMERLGRERMAKPGEAQENGPGK
jgi:hypothetical protein